MNTRMNSLPNSIMPPFPFPFFLRFPPNLNGMPIFPNGIPFPYSMFMESQRLREQVMLDAAAARDVSLQSSSSETPRTVSEKGLQLKWINGSEPEASLKLNFLPMSNDISEECKKIEPCDYLSILILNQDNSYFYAIVYVNSDSLSVGDVFEIPQSWKNLCQTTSNETIANLSIDDTVLRPIKLGSEIVIFKSKPSKSNEKSKSIKVRHEDEGEETPFTSNLSANLNNLYSNQFSINVVEPSISDSNEDTGILNQPSSEAGYQCERCGKTFTYSYYRDKHLKYTRCVDNGDRKFPCPLCTRSFEKRDRLRIHILHVHENHRPHVCSVCKKAFSQSSSLNKHLRVHSGERPYACPFCSKCFTASSILRTHIRQHSGEKPFKCAFCGRSFASHAAHDSHVRRTHSVQETENLYKCQACDKCFDHPSHLNFHIQCVHN